MRSFTGIKLISRLIVVFTSVAVFLMLLACAKGTGTDVPPTAGATFTPAPYDPESAEATLPSFGWGGGAGGATLASPVDCTGEATSSSEILLAWTIPADFSGHSGFRIYQGVESLEQEVAEPETFSVVIGNLDPNVQYHFDVRTYNASGESEPDGCAVDVTTLE